MNGKIYKIYSEEKTYYGSTSLTINERMSKHLNHYKSFLKGTYHYVSVFEILKDPNYKVELVESFKYETKRELLNREGEWIRKNDCVNINKLGRTPKEYYLDNREYFLKLNDLWRKNNRDRKIEMDRNYYQKNKLKINEKKKEKVVCECGRSVRLSDIARHKKTSIHRV